MATYNTPGVYIQEIPKLPASVAQVATAIPAFIGYTENTSYNGNSIKWVPVRIQSFLEYEQIFGGPNSEVKISVKITETGSGSNIVQKHEILPFSPTAIKHFMYYALQMYFANGGGPCYIVSAGPYGTVNKGHLTSALDALEQEDEPTLIVCPDAISIPSPTGAGLTNFSSLFDETLMQCAKLQDRFAIFDTYTESGDPLADGTAFRNNTGSNNLKYGAVYYPRLLTSLSYVYKNTQVTFKHGKVDGGGTMDTTGILDGKTLDQALTAMVATTTSAGDKAKYEAVLTESFLSSIRDSIAQTQIILSPSSAIAGVYASVDASRGVWKAPANVSLVGVAEPTVKITDQLQQTLNIDATSGKSINAIRTFTGKGVLVWGARTLAGNDNEWRYVNVRRLFITAEESIKKASAFVVFEPNDANTWVRVKAMIENYLTGLWRDGALAGATPQEAFFVNVGLGTTMTSDDILNGKLNIEVGMAAVRPAEFIILSFSHKLQTS